MGEGGGGGGGGGASSKPHGAKPPTQRFPTLPYATHVQKQHNTRAQDRHNVGGGRGDAHIRRLVTDGHHVYAVPFHRSQAVMMPPTSPMAPMEPSLSPMPPAAVQWAANAPSPAMCTRRRARSRRAPVVQQGGGEVVTNARTTGCVRQHTDTHGHKQPHTYTCARQADKPTVVSCPSRPNKAQARRVVRRNVAPTTVPLAGR